MLTQPLNLSLGKQWLLLSDKNWFGLKFDETVLAVLEQVPTTRLFCDRV